MFAAQPYGIPLNLIEGAQLLAHEGIEGVQVMRDFDPSIIHLHSNYHPLSSKSIYFRQSSIAINHVF